eukprot:CAMPEP_0170592704 /NCGR_PEP_ID=MMETSP0224-20130122/13062_1 /TAXON_ID=285029 /ORGANISM="Togula jolla, Strain CCCM 725" /LENGTH=134 /DNA_ID=CAMNT_0010916619 /DNA_START=514 /DNA_END=918 /DNA_ORIENTATION=-
MHRLLDAGVRTANLVWVAASTGVTVEEVITTPYAADLALGTMEDLLGNAVVIPELAGLAEIVTENFATCCALPRRTLVGLTPLANHLLDLGPVHLVPVLAIVVGLVVAVAAPEGFATARGNDAAAPGVVPTAQR